MCQSSESSGLLKRRGSATITKIVKRAADEIPTLDELKRAIPSHCFQKSLLRSLAWVAFDIAVLLTVVMLYTSFLAKEHSTLMYWAVTLVYWNVAGFYLWNLFVIGHDCGHATFSGYPLIDDTVGWLVHSAILTPYFSWQESHRRHHLYHNHEVDDYGHLWITENTDVQSMRWIHQAVIDNAVVRVLLAPLMWWMYLLNGVDDSHLCPIGGQRLWKDASNTLVVKCYLSTAGVVTAAYAWWVFLGRDAHAYLFVYVVPEIVMGMWVLIVTYLHHHQPEVQAYDNDTFSFVRAAFEVVNRRYGGPIDHLMHYGAYGHLVHHLFFKSVPHYHLREATDVLHAYLHQNGYGHLLKTDDGFFLFRFYELLWNKGFRAHVVTAES